MEQNKIERINLLAKKAKQAPLSQDEAQEQAALREEYVAEYRANLKQQLDCTTVLRPDGTAAKLRQKGRGQ